MRDENIIDNKCPICGSEMIDVSKSRTYVRSYTFVCNNGCYHSVFMIRDTVDLLINATITIFDKSNSFIGYKYKYSGTNDTNFIMKKMNNDVKKEIQYWRDHDRYLLKIMGVD